MKARLASIDVLRGLVMVLMALDHARDFFTSFDIDPTDLKTTTVPLFLTRFVTHYCAPVFIFLAGTSAYLSRANGKTLGALSRLLVTRGLFLVVLELSVVRFCWLFNVDYRLTFLQVIWVIGWSMVALAGLIHLPMRELVGMSVLIILGHNVLDHVHASNFGTLGPLWYVLHEQNWQWEPLKGHRVAIMYPLIPWVFVMTLGYACGVWIEKPREERRRALVYSGALLTAGFFVVRGANLYGDPHAWSVQKSSVFTVLSFFNVEKYPPSLTYLLITLGPALLFLGLFDPKNGLFERALTVFGRVPLFYYVFHLFVLNALALGIYLARTGHRPPAIGYEHRWSLAAVYAVWISVVGALYPLCRWYGRKKGQGKSIIWSYI